MRVRASWIAPMAAVALVVLAAPALAHRAPTTVVIGDRSCLENCVVWGTVASPAPACQSGRRIHLWALRGAKPPTRLDSARTNANGEWAVKFFASQLSGDETGFRVSAAAGTVGSRHHRINCSAGRVEFEL